jgi:hypothetical protein
MTIHRKIEMVIATELSEKDLERKMVIIGSKLGTLKGIKFTETDPQGRGRPLGRRTAAELLLASKPDEWMTSTEISEVTGQNPSNTLRALKGCVGKGTVRVKRSKKRGVVWAANLE